MYFTHLNAMMGGYFHQDYDYLNQTEEEIVRQYAADSLKSDVEGTVQNLDALLATSTSGLLARFEREAGSGDFMIGETDEQARKWLEAARRILVDALDTPGRVDAEPPPQPEPEPAKRTGWRRFLFGD